MAENLRDFQGSNNFLKKILDIENLKVRRQRKEYFEVISLHCNTSTLICFAITLRIIPNCEAHQIYQIFG